MTLNRSFFKTNFWKLRRDFGWGLAYLFVLLLFQPLLILMSMFREEIQMGQAVKPHLQHYYGYLVSVFFYQCIPLGAAALLEAFHQFSYLYRKQTVDFYHGLPENRTMLFWGRYLNGLALTLIPALLAQLLSWPLVLSLYPPIDVQQQLLRASLSVLVFFLLSYHLAILCLSLCGRALTALLSTGFGFSVFPLSYAVYIGAYWIWVDNGHPEIDGHRTMMELSPLSQLVYLRELMADGFALRILINVLAAAALLLSAWLLYKKRPAEACGEALSFKRCEAPLRIFLCLLAAASAGIIFEQAMEHLGWMVFGAVLAAVLTHGIMEVIYSSNLRLFFRKPIQMALCAVLGCAFLFAARADLGGLRRYVPSVQQLSGVYINLNGYDDGYEKLWMQSPEDKALAVQLGHLGVEALKTVPNDGRYSPDTVHFMLIYRYHSGLMRKQYFGVPQEAFNPLYLKLFESEDYKATAFPLLRVEREEQLKYMTVLSSDYWSEEGLSSAQIRELLAVYLPELQALSGEEQLASYPVYRLRAEMRAKYGRPNDDYPVYPSFKKTIALLKSWGFEPFNSGQVTEASYREHQLNEDEVNKVRKLVSEGQLIFRFGSIGPALIQDDTISVELRQEDGSKLIMEGYLLRNEENERWIAELRAKYPTSFDDEAAALAN